MPRSERGRGWELVRTCPDCGRLARECGCAPARSSGRPVFRIRLERRRGKPVTVAGTEGLAAAELKRLVKELKSRLATGGTARDGVMELQGDHRERLREVLSGRGFRVKG